MGKVHYCLHLRVVRTEAQKGQMTFQEAQQIYDKRDFTPSYVLFLEYLLEEKESRKIFTLSLGEKKENCAILQPSIG